MLYLINMNKFFFLLLALVTGGCESTTSKQVAGQLTLTNNAAIELTDKPITIARSAIGEVPSGKVYPIVVAGNDTIAAQLDDVDGDEQWDELFFVIDFKPNETRNLTITWSNEQPNFVRRTNVRFGKRMAANVPLQPASSETLAANELPRSLGFQRYQTDGPSWENDKVGFRHYLDGRNAKDVFGKLIPDMSPDSVGINTKGEVEDNYHVMEKWGRDILAVGNSVGIGGISLVKGDTLLRLGVTVNDSINNVEQTTFKIATKGPVRSVLQFNYSGWKPNAHSYTAQEKVSIWPGMYAYHNQVKFSGLTGVENLGIGIVNIMAEGNLEVVKVNEQWTALLSHEKHAYDKMWWIGLALLVPTQNYEGFIQAPKTGQLANSYIARLKLENNQPIEYFAIAAWELSNEDFKNPAYFKAYVLNMAQQVSAQVTIKVN